MILKRKQDEEGDEIGGHYSTVTFFNSISIFFLRKRARSI